MNFLVDAQLPRQIALQLNLAGHNARHTLSLPRANATSDSEVIDLSDREERIVLTKDLDFRDSYLLRKQPKKLLLITTGNIRNPSLHALLFAYLPQIVAGFKDHSFLELSREHLIIHD